MNVCVVQAIRGVLDVYNVVDQSIRFHKGCVVYSRREVIYMYILYYIH
jgi:hypothetical protein